MVMEKQQDLFDLPALPDLKTVKITRRSNPESSKRAAKHHQLISQRGKCWQMYLLIKRHPGLTFTEYWGEFGPELKKHKFENKVDCSRQLYVLKKKNIIKRVDPGRICRVTGRVCCTWEVIREIAAYGY